MEKGEDETHQQSEPKITGKTCSSPSSSNNDNTYEKERDEDDVNHALSFLIQYSTSLFCFHGNP